MIEIEIEKRSSSVRTRGSEIDDHRHARLTEKRSSFVETRVVEGQDTTMMLSHTEVAIVEEDEAITITKKSLSVAMSEKMIQDLDMAVEATTTTL